MESTTTELSAVGQRVYRRRPTALETQEKTTETESRSSLETVYACTVPGWPIPGKIWRPTNQIRAISAGAHVPRAVADLGGVRGVQMHPPLAASDVLLRT